MNCFACAPASVRGEGWRLAIYCRQTSRVEVVLFVDRPASVAIIPWLRCRPYSSYAVVVIPPQQRRSHPGQAIRMHRVSVSVHLGYSCIVPTYYYYLVVLAFN